MAFDFFTNGLKGNSTPFPNSVQSRNSFAMNNSLALPNKDPIQQVINKSLEASIALGNKTNDLLNSLNNKVSQVFDSLKKQTNTSSINLEKQSQRENDLKINVMLKSFEGYFTKSLEASKAQLKKLSLLDNLKGFKPNISPETMIVLAILLLNKLGLGNITDTFKGLGNVINTIKAFGSEGLAFIKTLSGKGLNYLRELSSKGLSSIGTWLKKGLPFIESLKTKGLEIFERGTTHLKNFGSKGFNLISNFTKKGLDKFSSLTSRGVSALEKFGKNAMTVFESMGKLSKTIFNGLGKGFVSVYEFLGKLGGAIGEVLGKIPGMSSLLKLGKFAIGKGAQALFSGYDFATGYADAPNIAGTKDPTTTQKIGSGLINVGTGFVNSISSLGSMVTGTNLGNINSKGVYNYLTGSDSQYMGQNISGMAGIQQIGAVYNTLTGTPINPSAIAGKKRNGKPVDNMNISSYPAPLRGTRPHKGTDIAVPSGTPVYATASGKVFIGSDPTGWGTYIQINHANGFMTRYAHLSKLNVSNGQIVNEGDLLGLSGGNVGSKGAGNSGGAHLHYELWKDGKWLNPFGGSDKLASEITNLKPVNTQGTVEYSDGANMSSAMPTMSANIMQETNLPSANIADIAFKGIVLNEGAKSATQLTKDNIGYTFGLSQFNSAKNPNAWKKLGFSDSELSSINKGNFDKNSIQNRLNMNKDKIQQLDLNQKNSLFSYATNFGKKYNLNISNPEVLANIMDIANQYGEDLDSTTASKLIKFSGGNVITPQAINQWRMQTLQGTDHPQDQIRRFGNIKKTMANMAVASSLAINPSMMSGGANFSASQNIANASINAVSNIPNTNVLGSIQGYQGNNLNVLVKLELGGNFVSEVAKKTDIIEKQIKESEKALQNTAVKEIVSNATNITTDKTINQGITNTKETTKPQSLESYLISSLMNNPTTINTVKNITKEVDNIYKQVPQSIKDFGKDVSSNKDMLNDLATKGYNLATNFNINDAKAFGSDLVSNKEALNNLALSGLNMFGIKGIDSSSLPVIPENVLNAGNAVIKNQDALTNVGSTLISTFDNPNDILGNVSKVSNAIFNNKEALGSVGNAFTNLFKPNVTTNNDLAPINEKILEPVKQIVENSKPQVIPIPMQSQQSSQPMISKSMNINDMYLMTIVSGVFD